MYSTRYFCVNLMKLKFSRQIFEKCQYQILSKCLVGAELFHVDKQTDGQAGRQVGRQTDRQTEGHEKGNSRLSQILRTRIKTFSNFAFLEPQDLSLLQMCAHSIFVNLTCR
jgi:hypothetical protein